MARERPSMAGFRVDAREKAALEGLAGIRGSTVAQVLRLRVFPWAAEELAAAVVVKPERKGRVGRSVRP